MPQPHLVLIQARLPFSLLVAFFCGPSLPGHRDQGRQRRRPALRDMAVVEGQVSGVGEAAADQQPVPRRGGGDPRPPVVPAALAAGPARAGLPRRSLPLRPYTSSPATQQNGTPARAAAVIIAAASTGLAANLVLAGTRARSRRALSRN